MSIDFSFMAKYDLLQILKRTDPERAVQYREKMKQDPVWYEEFLRYEKAWDEMEAQENNKE